MLLLSSHHTQCPHLLIANPRCTCDRAVYLQTRFTERSTPLAMITNLTLSDNSVADAQLRFRALAARPFYTTVPATSEINPATVPRV
jgi:hypothetical protein